MQLLAVRKSDRKGKKLVAIFSEDGNNTKVHFGAAGMDDYTLKHDKEQRERYRKRHAAERDQAPNTPGALAYWILWGESTSKQQNIRTFKQKNNV